MFNQNPERVGFVSNPRPRTVQYSGGLKNTQIASNPANANILPVSGRGNFTNTQINIIQQNILQINKQEEPSDEFDFVRKFLVEDDFISDDSEEDEQESLVAKRTGLSYKDCSLEEKEAKFEQNFAVFIVPDAPANSINKNTKIFEIEKRK